MAYNPNYELTLSQQRNEGLKDAVSGFLDYFKIKKAKQDEAEKEAMIKEISTSPTSTVGKDTTLGMDAAGMPTGITNGPAGDANAQHLADVKARYLMKYGQAPATGADMFAEDLIRGEKVAQVGDAKQKRAAETKFKTAAQGDTTLSDTEKAFYGMNPAAYGDRLKPTGITYLPTDQGFLPMPSKTSPGAAAAPAVPLQTPSGATPKPFQKDPAAVRWVSKVNKEGKTYQENPVTGEIRYTGEEAPVKAGGANQAQTIAAKLANLKIAKQQLQQIKTHFADIKGTGASGKLDPRVLLPTETGDQFDAAVDAFKQTATALTRTPGVGSMSDFETKLSQAPLPKRKGEYNSVTEQKIKAWEDLVNTLEEGYKGMQTGDGQNDTPPDENADPMGLGF